MIQSVVAIGTGATAGALIRWGLSLALNTLFPLFPLGTLAANLLGGYLIGLALALFAHHPEINMVWRLLVVTGFLGALTTFSTFSAEVAMLIQQSRFFWAVCVIGGHVIGSLCMTFLGMMTYSFFR